MITNDDAEECVAWLGKNARKIAQARAERLYLEQWIKTVKANIQEEHGGTSIAAAEVKALASPRYLSALQAFKEAVEEDEYLRFVASATEAKIEAYRSQEATRRAEGRATT